MGRAGKYGSLAPFARDLSLLAEAELTWPEDGEDDDAGDEEGKDSDAMTEAKDEADVEDASSSACGVTSEGRKIK